jgi:hypothetical protein
MLRSLSRKQSRLKRWGPGDAPAVQGKTGPRKQLNYKGQNGQASTLQAKKAPKSHRSNGDNPWTEAQKRLQHPANGRSL